MDMNIPDIDIKSDTSLQKNLLDALSPLNAAIKNIRLYPPSSDLIRAAIEKAFQAITAILNEDASLVLAESGKNYIIGGQILPPDEQQKHPQLMGLFEIMANFEIKSMEFKAGLEQAELQEFIEMLSGNPEEAKTKGLFQDIIDNKSFPHIGIDHKVYIEIDKDRQILSQIDLKDEDVVRHLLGIEQISQEDVTKVREMAKNPQWFSQLLQSGMQMLRSEEKQTDEIQLVKGIGQMIKSANDMAQPNEQEKINHQLADLLASLDEKTLELLCTHNPGNVVADKLFENVLDRLDKEKFKNLAQNLQLAVATTPNSQKASSDTQLSGQALHSIQNAVELMQRYGNVHELPQSQTSKNPTAKDLPENQAKELLSGDITPVQIEKLTSVIENLLSQQAEDQANQFIDRLSAGYTSNDPSVLKNVSTSSAKLGDLMVTGKQFESLNRLSDSMLTWLQRQSEVTPVVEDTCQHMQKLAHNLIDNGNYADGQRILSTFHNLYTQNLDKDVTLKTLADKTLRESVDTKTVNAIWEEFRSNKNNQGEEAATLLNNLGEVALEWLLDLMQDTTDPTERKQILDNVSQIGNSWAPLIAKRIQQSGPWYYIRNLTAMMGEVGQAKHLKDLQPLLNHEEIPVQRQALKSMFALGGAEIEKTLLAQLPQVDDWLKIDIIEMLGTIESKQSVPMLMNMLQEKPEVSSELREELEVKVCNALGAVGASEAVPLLNAIRQQKGPYADIDVSVASKEAAINALAQIKSKHPALPADSVSQSQEPASDTPGGDTIPDQSNESTNIEYAFSDTAAEPEDPSSLFEFSDPQDTSATNAISAEFEFEAVEKVSTKAPQEYVFVEDQEEEEEVKIPDDPEQQEQMIDDYVAGGKKQAAVRMLSRLIHRYAREKDFDKAEELKERLIEIDPMALPAIIRSGEIIEEERSEFTDQNFPDVWPELYENLSLDEINALEFAMEERIWNANQYIFRQGEQNSQLYFINQGTLKLVYQHGEKETLLQTLTTGDVAGADTFFPISMCSTSMITLSRVKLNFINRDILEEWKSECPALVSRLHDFCLKSEKSVEALKNKKLDRRAHKRYQLSGKMSLQLLKKTGEGIGKSFTGNLIDISAGGMSCSFFIKTTKKQDARMLLGQPIKTKFTLPLRSGPQKLTEKGVITAVSFDFTNDYAFHIKFDQPINETIAAEMTHLPESTDAPEK